MKRRKLTLTRAIIAHFFNDCKSSIAFDFIWIATIARTQIPSFWNWIIAILQFSNQSFSTNFTTRTKRFFSPATID